MNSQRKKKHNIESWIVVCWLFWRADLCVSTVTGVLSLAMLWNMKFIRCQFKSVDKLLSSFFDLLNLKFSCNWRFEHFMMNCFVLMKRKEHQTCVENFFRSILNRRIKKGFSSSLLTLFRDYFVVWHAKNWKLYVFGTKCGCTENFGKDTIMRQNI